MIMRGIDSVLWVAEHNPMALLLVGGLILWLAVRSLVTLLALVRERKLSRGWVPTADEQRRRRRTARAVRWGTTGLTVGAFAGLAWLTFQPWAAPLLPQAAVVGVLGWWLLTCLLRGLERVLRLWATPDASA